MAEEYKGAVLSRDISEAIKPIAEQWAAALNASVKLLHSEQLSNEERRDVFQVAVQSVAALFAPTEPTLVERQHYANFFLSQLDIICEQYFEDKRELEASR